VVPLLSGISAIPVTPFSTTGAIDEGALGRVIERLATAGLEIIVPCGNTGEFASLSEAEAERVTALTLELVGPRAAVIAGVGGSLETAVGQARLATARGAAGIMIHFPSDPYHSNAGMVRYYETLAAATDGVVIPYLRSPGVSEGVLESIARIENVVAVKYALPDLMGLARLVRNYGEKLTAICGLAELWAPFFWMLGARGFTSGLVNVNATLSRELLAGLRAGDAVRAMRAWESIRPLEELRARHNQGNNVVVLKHALSMLGVCERTVRPPLADLSEEDATALRLIIERWPGVL
jgi:4-hydroxy-tetrahydrodipicolinate synthase